MTRDEAKKLLPIIQAFAEGETVQISGVSTPEWADVANPEDVAFGSKAKYRIKPKPREVYLSLREDGSVAAVFSSPHCAGAIKFREVIE